MCVPPQPSDRANISPRLEQRCTVVVYGLPRYQRGPFGEWDAGASDGRQLRHTPDAALRIHVRVGKLVLKTQTEERASALNTSGRGSLWKSLDARCGMFLSTKTGTMIEYSLGSCRGRKKVAQVPRSRRESRSESTERT